MHRGNSCATSLTDWLSLLPCAPSHSQPATCLGAPPHHITIPTTQPFVRCERISSPASRRPGRLQSFAKHSPPAGHDQPSATRINAVASIPAKNAPIIGKAAINFARCERGPPSAHAARRHGSKYFLQSHADAHPPINERMNNKAVMPARGRFRPPFFDPALLRSACFADTRAP